MEKPVNLRGKMITKAPNGSGGTSRAIVVQLNQKSSGYRGRIHDPWPSHAVAATLAGQSGENSLAVLQTAATGEFTLKDGSGWVYIYGGFRNCSLGDDIITEVGNYPVEGLPGGYTGEGFNAIMRPMATQKLDQAGFNAIQALAGADGSTCP